MYVPRVIGMGSFGGTGFLVVVELGVESVESWGRSRCWVGVRSGMRTGEWMGGWHVDGGRIWSGELLVY